MISGMRKIVIEELIRAGAGMIFWMAGLYGLDYIGISAGEVTRAILFAVGVLFVCLLLFIVRKRAGMKW